jgi:hypothetical protein
MFRADNVGESRLLLTLLHYLDNVFGVFCGLSILLEVIVLTFI